MNYERMETAILDIYDIRNALPAQIQQMPMPGICSYATVGEALSYVIKALETEMGETA